MTIADHQRNHEYCLTLAAELAGVPVRALTLEWIPQQILRDHLRLEKRRGLASEHPLMTITGGPKGQTLAYGLEKYSLAAEGKTIPIVHVVAPQCGDWTSAYYDFWGVPIDAHRLVYRFLRRLERRTLDAPPPILHEDDRRRLWDNTIGFLRHGSERLKAFGISRKRGVVLLGEPGNGKTMAARWLFSQCQRHGLRWKSVTAEDYEAACEMGKVHTLFDLEGPGIILFDDLDQSLRDRELFDAGSRRTTILTELDGLHPREGVVYLFTSNNRGIDLDPAFRRPGRIDLILTFPRPDEELRMRFVSERWTSELVAALDLPRVAKETAGLSFAEMDEVRKLLVLCFLETGVWNWEAGWSAFVSSRAANGEKPAIGFATPATRSRPSRGRSIVSGA